MRFRIVHRGAVSPLSPSYDTRFGTATDASGWITFALRVGCRRVWCDSSRADDTGDGLSAATAKKTFAAAAAVFVSGYTAGDQLMLASGGAYTDTGTSSFINLSGFSLTYPLAILSYDSASPSDATRYGRLTGSSMPTLVVSGGNTIDQAGDSNTNYFAVQGVQIDAQNVAGVAVTYSGIHNGTCFQNCRFKTARLVLNGSASFGSSSTLSISKCSFWGQWNTDGNFSGLFFGFTDGVRVQDCVFVHCGWKIGANRDDAATLGGANFFGHSYYYSAHGTNARFDRIVSVDSAYDGQNLRGAAAATCLVDLDDPLGGGNMGGWSNSYTEAPNGVLITVDDALVMGGANTNTSTPEGGGYGNLNTVYGTYIRNAAMFDNPIYGTGNNTYLGAAAQDASQVDQFILMDRIRGYNYAFQLQGSTGSFPAKTHTAWSNCILDVSATGTNNSVWTTGTFPNAKTRDQVVTAMLTGMNITPGADYSARKGQLVNAMLWRPDFQWAQALISIGLPAYGLTPSYALASPPDMTGITPAAIY